MRDHERPPLLLYAGRYAALVPTHEARDAAPRILVKAAQCRVPAFIYQPSSQRVVFGTGTLREVPAEADRLDIRRALVISTPVAGKLRRSGGAAASAARCGSVFADARMHTPVEVTEEAMAIVAADRIDGTVAIGGGSTTGLGKAIAWRTDLPQIVVPTTYAGSEMTDILGETAGGEKKTLRDAKIMPETVIYDVDLTLGLPAGAIGDLGLNAIAHAVEGALRAGRQSRSSR